MLDFIKRLFGIKKSSGSKEGTVKFYNYKKGFGFITLKILTKRYLYIQLVL